ncbi:hypothetical protein ACFQU1_22550 [Chelatococcus sp. GCM10030263]|uniref:hypothetical protein n=1 Tax=Chelatococcus sp. GCM10030263 TaxID=3273387 RepID=UPI003614A308
MHLTKTDVVAVLGPVDDAFIADLVATGATTEELTQAWAWVNSDEALMGEGRPLPSGKVAELVDLLAPQEEEP